MDQRGDRLAAEIRETSLLIGSSLGGLSSLLFVRDYPERVAGLVLSAPAVGFFDPRFQTPEINQRLENLVIPAQIPTYVIAAIEDEIIPLEAIEALVARSSTAQILDFIKVHDTHALQTPPARMALEGSVRALISITGRPPDSTQVT